ncbi:cysteine protease StiP domain-containing protein [Pseudomonas sp. UBA6562]|uniref:cysteine protease StiP domain-containing protein n=1 Tax=Pseudomonas sp. UBA6562 TaxID=1947332 RepID=UPI0025F22F18|nr:cysteine protease StiP domain-containing protein [Pseudomonas sp. UBA6562]
MRELRLPCATVGSGSYLPDDVQFLLRPVNLELTDVLEKERLIQTQQKHYSEMISAEHAPSATHMTLYERSLRQNGVRMAADVQALALALAGHAPGTTLALVSFVRAGLPLGVLLRRALRDLGRDVRHYGISIVRDRGIDQDALDAIVDAHGADSILFVDGWTGKGAIAGELQRCLGADPRFTDAPRLVVLADPCGRAWLAASAEDWIIPSGILGATVSGLVSRSIWPVEGGLHGCVVYDALREHDVTRSFIERIEAARVGVAAVPARPWTPVQAAGLQAEALAVVQGLARRFDIANFNRIKPGIAEATRAVLRRVPDQVLVRDRGDADVQLLIHLTDRAGIEVQAVGDELGPYRAVTIIRGVSR